MGFIAKTTHIMGFKEENYTPKGLCACVFLWMMITCNHAFAQTAPHCPIRVDFEPRIEQVSNAANSTRQNLFPFFSSWQELSNLRLSDNNYAVASLDGYRRTTMAFGDKMSFNIPQGSEISGIEIFVEGHSRGDGFAEGLTVQLLNYQGQRAGENKAPSALPIDKDWSTTSDSTDFIWKYGSEDDNWGLDLNHFMVTNPNFGYAIQVRNKLPQPIEVLIDNIQIVVHYKPLYTICTSHPCIPFYIDESDDPQVTYEWYLPQGWELISDSEHDPAINIKPSYAGLGSYEICVESFFAEDSQGTCCRKYNYEDCDPGQISGEIFLDQNGNFSDDSGDIKQENVTVNLYESNGTLLLTTNTDNDGKYLFPTVFQGEYFIEVEQADGLTYVIANIGNDQDDSDITNEFGIGTSSLISVSSGEEVKDIDAGLSKSLTIGDYVWEDLNGDGIQQDGEPGIEGINVTLANSLTNNITVITDNNGFYQFPNIPSSEYLISFDNAASLQSTVLNNGPEDIDNDYNGAPIPVSYLDGGNVDTIDAGFFRTASIGDFVWEDLNENGIQEIDEPGLQNVILYLKDNAGILLDSTNTDTNGFYLFDNLVPGVYTLEVKAEEFLTPTVTNIGMDITQDSDGIDQGSTVTTASITLISGDNNTDIDFGFYILPVNISGFTWIDANNDGQYQLEESFLGNIQVSLFDVDGILVADTLSDAGGFFTFEDQNAGTYYLQYELPEGSIFTEANIGVDLSDSDVDGSNGPHTTEQFTLLPGEISIDNAAGYIILPSVEGLTWEDLDGNGTRESTEPIISGIVANLRAANGDLIGSDTTDEQGLYIFEKLTIGDYYIEFIKNETLEYTEHIENVTLNSDVDGIISIGATSVFSLIGNQELTDIDAGFFRYGSIGDFVWNDQNTNGIQDTDESGLANVLVTLKNSLGETITTIETDELGIYSFTNLAPGTYTIELLQDESFALTIANQGDEELDSDAAEENGIITSDPIILTSGAQLTDIDFGFFEKPSTISGFTWIDLNNDGQFQLDESLLANVNVSLYLANGDFISQTMTDGGGFYTFPNIAANDVYLQFSLPDGHIFTIANQGDDLTDSDVTGEIVAGSTGIITPIPGIEDFNNSAGFQLLPKVGDYVWIDQNRNGIQDTDEVGLNGVTVNLHSDNGTIIASTITNTNPTIGTDGYYLFDTLEIGSYYISFETIDTLDFAPYVDTDLILNSDITEANGNGTTSTFSLVGNQCNLDIDGGYSYIKSGISGEVWDDSDNDGIQNPDDRLIEKIKVTLYSDTDIELSTTTTDSLGKYAFNALDAGSYYIVFDTTERYQTTLPLQGMDESLDSDVDGSQLPGSTSIIILQNGIDITDIDAGLVDGSVTISGFTWTDDNNNGTRELGEGNISDINVTLYNIDGTLIDETMVDPTGIYAFTNILQGEYYLVFDNQNEGCFNVEADQGPDNIDDDITNDIIVGSTDTITVEYFSIIPPVSAGYYKLASIGDMAFIDMNENGTNDSEPGLNNVVVNLMDLNGTTVQSKITSPGGVIDSGFYFMDGIVPGQYQLQFVRPLSYQFITGDVGSDDAIDSDVITVNANLGMTDTFLITSGSINNTLDAGFVFATPTESSISGIAWNDENANGLYEVGELLRSDIVIELLDNTGTSVTTESTNSAGEYTFNNLSEGFYTLRSSLSNNEIPTIPNVGMDDEIDSDFLIAGIETEQFFLAIFEDKDHVDLGVVNTISIGDFVWEDVNNNGTQEASELGLSNIEVTISDATNSISETTTTGTDGKYQFPNLPAGSYQVCVTIPDGHYVGKKDIGIEQLDSDSNEDGCTDFILFTGGTNNDIDISLTKETSIQGVAFTDINGNGIKNTTDPGIDDVPVFLYSGTGIKLDSTITASIGDTTGFYTFTNLQAGDYYVVFDIPEEYILSDGNSGPDDVDSDISNAFGEGSTDIITLESGQVFENLDGGAYLPACIGDRIWEDLNKDGYQDPGELGVGGIEVIIFRSFGVPFDTVYTNSIGEYKFSGLKQGLYFIQFMIPQEYTITLTDEGTNDDIDNDADETGKTPLISLAHGADLTSVDCGIFLSSASLRSVVWEDLNGDGMRQSVEARIPDVRISLMDDAGEIVASTISNALGLYAFQEIPEGSYNIFVDLSNTDYAFTGIDMTGDDLFDSDIHANGESDVFTSAQVLSVPNVDVGLFEMGSIGGIAWNDENQNGIYDLDESKLSNVKVSLYNDANEKVSEIMTSESEDENISFTNLRPGKYRMVYKFNKNLAASMNSIGSENDNNSDIILNSGVYSSPMFTVESANIVTHIDAGFFTKTNAIASEEVSSNSILENEEGQTEETKAADKQNSALEISIHPNPATNYIKIEIADKDNATVKVLNATKNVVLTATANQMEQIDLRHLHPGVYYVILEQNGKTATKKLIKVH